MEEKIIKDEETKTEDVKSELVSESVSEQTSKPLNEQKEVKSASASQPKDVFREVLEFPSEVQVSVDKGIFSVKGPKGELSRKIHNPLIKVELQGNKIILTSKTNTKKSKKLINTFRAHIRNTFKGVTEGHVYKLKICSGHFPMTVSVKGDEFEIKNFIGEKIPRTIKIPQGVKVAVDGDLVVVEGSEKEKTGQTAASIEQLTKRSGFDRRIFQDGIYIIEKDGKEIKL